MTKIILSDSSLRDGNHAVLHQISRSQIQQYVKLVNEAKIDIIEIGHGNGLGASSLQLGFAKVQDRDMLKSAKENMGNTRLSSFIIPGFGSINRELQMAVEEGVEIMKIATHCTEADISERYIDFACKNNMLVYGVLMMSHMATKQKLLEEARKMISYGAQAIILMDSAGAYLPEEVQQKVGLLVQKLDVPVGFHAHNNLGLAIGNSIAAVKAGATIIDGTIKGFGAGAGNTPIEIIAAILVKMDYEINADLHQILKLSQAAEDFLVSKIPGINLTNLLSGFYGIFSGFAKHVDRVAKNFNVNYKDIYKKLGASKVVAGQEDIIIKAAKELQKN